MRRSFGAALDEDNTRRLEVILAGQPFGPWLRGIITRLSEAGEMESHLEALRGEAASASAAVEAQAARQVELEAACREAEGRLDAVRGLQGEVEFSAAAVIEELGQQATERLEEVLAELTTRIADYGQVRELAGKLADELPLARVLKAMSASPDTVTAQEAGSILARVALWSSKGGLNPEGRPPEAVSKGNFLLGVSRLSLHDLCRWGLFLLGPPLEAGD